MEKELILYHCMLNGNSEFTQAVSPKEAYKNFKQRGKNLVGFANIKDFGVWDREKNKHTPIRYREIKGKFKAVRIRASF